MSSQFFGLNIGASALFAFQASINTTANNISNVQTKGYCRQKVNIESSGPIRETARYGSVGTGVIAISITQERNLYYDARYWENNSSKGLYEEKLYYLNQIETHFADDDTQNGFSTIFSKMFNGLDTLKTNASDESVRNQFINQSQSLCSFFNSMAQSLSDIQEDCNEEIKTSVESVNAIAKKIALLNKEINNIEVNGGYANELRDQRANLIDELSAIVHVETTEYEIENTYGENLGGTNYTVIINGQVLVEGKEYRQLEWVAYDYTMNQTDVDGLVYVRWADTKMDFAAATASAGGSLKALFEIRDGNANAALTGGVRSADTEHITLETPSITDVNALNIPSRGQVTIGNKTYAYDGWSAEVDEDGKITSVTFNLKEAIDPREAGALAGKKITCGKNVSSQGIPYYQQQLNEFLRKFSQLFNDIEKSGVDLDGNQMGAFFIAKNMTGTEYEFDGWMLDENGSYARTITSDDDTYYQLQARNVAVHSESLKNSRRFSTASEIINGEDKYDIVEELLKLQDDVNMFRGDTAGKFLETMLSDVSVDVERNRIYAENYYNLEASINNQRTSVSGVDEDEEGINLIKFQHAYNMASKVISVLNEIYNKLINETGVT